MGFMGLSIKGHNYLKNMLKIVYIAVARMHRIYNFHITITKK